MSSIAMATAVNSQGRRGIGILFVVGHPRSGTTLVSEIIARSRQAYITPETKALYPAVAHRNNLAKGQGGIDLLLQIRTSGLSLPAKVKVLIDTLATLAVPDSVRLIGEKSPDHALWVDQLLEADERCLVVHVLRDPVEVALSFSKVWWGEKNVYFGVARWIRTVRAVTRASKKHPNRLLTLNLASLQRQPEQQVKRLCDFLDLVYDADMLSPRPAPATYQPGQEPWKSGANEVIREPQPIREYSRLIRWATNNKYRMLTNDCREYEKIGKFSEWFASSVIQLMAAYVFLRRRINRLVVSRKHAL